MELGVLLLQILTILVSVASLIISFVSSLQENKKKNYIKVVTEQRLKNKEIVRDNVSKLLSASHYCNLMNLDYNSLKSCCQNASNVETVLKRFYNEDLSLLKAIDELLLSLQKWLEKDTSLSKVEEVRTRLLYEFSVYDYSDWNFIKTQYAGNHLDSEVFDEIYSKTKQSYPFSKIF